MKVPSVTIVPPEGSSASPVEVGRAITFAGGGYGFILRRLIANPAPLEGSSVSNPRAAGAIGGARSPGARDVRLQGSILARDFDEANRMRDALLAACYGYQDPIRLRAVRDGVSVQLEAVLSGEPEFTSASLADTDFDLFFVADDPWWYAVVQSSEEVDTSGVSCENEGNAETWPVFTVEGPSSGEVTAFTIENASTGEKLELSGISLNPSEVLIISMKPGFERLQNGASAYFNERSAGSSFWALQPGVNLVKYAATGGTPASVSAVWRSAWSS